MATLVTLNGAISIVDGKLRGSAAIDNENYFVITGTGFGTKAHQTTPVYDDYATATDGQTLPSYKSNYVLYNHLGGYISTANPRYTGMKSAANDSGVMGASNSEFNTSSLSYTPSDKVFLSYYTRLETNLAVDYGVIKHTRITAATQGGVYNGVGAHKFDSSILNGQVEGAKLVYTTSSGVQEVPAQYLAIGVNQWVQVQVEVKLSTPGVADGIWRCRTHTGSVRDQEINLACVQRNNGETWQLDTILLGLMQANVKRYRTILSHNILPDTVYTATLESVDYSVNSGTNPTLLSILNALATVVNNAGKYAIVNTSNEIYIASSASSGVAQATYYDSKFTERKMVSQISDLYLDINSFSRIEACDSAIYENRVLAAEPIPYAAWADDRIVLRRNWHSLIPGTKHLHLIKDDLSTVYLGVCPAFIFTYENPPLVSGNIYRFLGGATVPNVTRASTKKLVNATAINGLPANADGYIFNQTGGLPFTVQSDATRGKVLYTTQDVSNFNSCLRYQSAAIPEQTYVYRSYWMKAKLQLSGSPYPHYFQLKNYRFNYINDVNDNTVLDLKLHTQNYSGSATGNNLLLHNRTGFATETFDLGASQLAAINDTWFKMEVFVYMGRVGVSDAKVICRLSQNGGNYIQKIIPNLTYTELNLLSSTDRFAYFIEQAYFGNFGVTPNEGTRPDTTEIWRDSSCAIQSWERFDICDTLTTQVSSKRQDLDYIISGNDTILNIDTTGWPLGIHNAYLRKISGIDANGWDIVADTKPIQIEVV